MLISSYFANCTSSSMNWTVSYKGTGLRGSERSISRSFCAHPVPLTTQRSSCTCGRWVNQPWEAALNAQERKRSYGNFTRVVLSLSASSFVLIPLYPFMYGTWVTVNNFPLMVWLWNYIFFFSFSPSAKDPQSFLRVALINSSSENMILFFHSPALGTLLLCLWWQLIFVSSHVKL